MSDGTPSGLNRRTFLHSAGIASAGFTAVPLMGAPVAPKPQAGAKPAFVPDGVIPVRLDVNGKKHDLTIESRVTLLDALRETLHLTGTKKGCDHGQCGACTVHVNGRRVNSCLTLAVMHTDDKVTTIEGIGSSTKLHAMQKAFVEHDAFQCGYCTPGQIMSAVALLKEPCGKDDAAVRECMSGNICRCGAYKNILAAIQDVRGNA